MYKLTSVEDQQKFIVPLNEYSEKLYYNQRLIIDNKIDVLRGTEPRAWKISKINRINSNGTVLVTLAQDKYDEHTDYIEYADKDDPTSIIGMWADYYSESGAPPTEEAETEDIHSVISYSGKDIIYVGGSAKKFTVNFYDSSTPIDFKLGQWKCMLDGNDVDSLVTYDYNGLEQNQVKIKFIGDESYMGKILKVAYISASGIESSVDITIGGF